MRVDSRYIIHGWYMMVWVMKLSKYLHTIYTINHTRQKMLHQTLLENGSLGASNHHLYHCKSDIFGKKYAITDSAPFS